MNFKDDMTKLELDILELVALGYKNREIAEKLNLKVNSVRLIISNLLKKFDSKNRTVLVFKFAKQKQQITC